MSVVGFELEWFDPVSRLIKTLYLKYFLDDNTIEILQEKSTFLKRIHYPEIQLADLFVGNSITIFSKLLIIRKYANSATERYMREREVHFLCTVSDDSQSIASLFTLGSIHRLRIGAVRTISSGQTLVEFVDIGGAAKASSFSESASRFSSVEILSVEEIKDIMLSSAMVCVDEPCTLCIIKPHVVKGHQAGRLLATIADAGYNIRGLFAVHLSTQIAEELLDVYREIYKPFSAMMEHMCSSPVLAVMVTAGSSGSYSIVEDFRELVGPLHPDLAKAVRPDSLRGRFGVNQTLNAVHCTDLVEDGEMECRYFFETIAGASA